MSNRGSAVHEATDDRLGYLAECAALLWPRPAVAAIEPRTPIGPGPTTHEFLILPHPRHPRLLVPAGARKASSSAVRHYGEQMSRAARLQNRALAAAVRLGLIDRLAGHRFRIRLDTRLPRSTGEPSDIEDHLSDVLGRAVSVSMHLSPPRANRKPVLQLLDASGTTIGFTKVGVGQLTGRLVRAEGAALETLSGAPLRHVRVPPVLAWSRWNGLELLTTGALPVWGKRVLLTEQRHRAAMREIAEMAGVTRSTLDASRYGTRLRARLDALPDGPAADALRALSDRVVATGGDAEIHFGSWHGDWTPWNRAVTPDRILAWDWERFDTDVPVGFDALHEDMQGAVVRDGEEPATAARDSLARSADLVGPLGVPTASAPVVGALYCLDIAARYVEDRQSEAGARLGDVARWLLPPLAAHIDSIAADPGKGLPV